MKNYCWNSRLNRDEIALLRAFSKYSRIMILQMLKFAQSGHPGGALSSIDFLTLLYLEIVTSECNRVVISNGHISAAVYSVLAGLDIIDESALLREGKNLSVFTIGGVTHQAFQAWELLSNENKPFDLVVVTSPRDFDSTVFEALRRNSMAITIEDHNPDCGLQSQIALFIQKHKLKTKLVGGLGVRSYQQSGDWTELYSKAGIDRDAIVKFVKQFI